MTTKLSNSAAIYRIISIFLQDPKEYPLTTAPFRTSFSSKQAPIKNKNSNKDVGRSYKSEVDKDTSSTTAPVQSQDTQTVTVQKDAESLGAGKGWFGWSLNEVWGMVADRMQKLLQTQHIKVT